MSNSRHPKGRKGPCSLFTNVFSRHLSSLEQRGERLHSNQETCGHSPQWPKGSSGGSHTLPQVGEAQVAGTGASPAFLPLCPKPSAPSFQPTSTPSKDRSHCKSENSRMSKAHQCFLHCSHSLRSYLPYYYLIGTFFSIDSLFVLYLNAYFMPHCQQ